MPSTTLFNRLTMPDGRRGWCMWFAMAALLAFGPGSSAAEAAGSGFKVLHVFGPAEARSATGDLVEGRGKSLYGTSWYGGAADSGTVFEITTDGVMNVTYPFGPKQRDPHEPVTGLTLANDGNFYGTTADGGSALFGTVFRLAPGKERLFERVPTRGHPRVTSESDPWGVGGGPGTQAVSHWRRAGRSGRCR